MTLDACANIFIRWNQLSFNRLYEDHHIEMLFDGVRDEWLTIGQISPSIIIHAQLVMVN